MTCRHFSHGPTKEEPRWLRQLQNRFAGIGVERAIGLQFKVIHYREELSVIEGFARDIGIPVGLVGAGIDGECFSEKMFIQVLHAVHRVLTLPK
jgi:hypothetical protein